MKGQTEQKVAMYWENREDGALQCHLCPHNCVIPQGKTGICGVRKNIESQGPR